MNVKEERKYRSKLLVFGEYTIIYGSEALAIPFDLFSGKCDTDTKKSTAYSLEHIIDFLEKTDLGFDLDVEKFKSEVQKGLFFNSNIPVGYGLGSSGALTAAIYDRYVTTPAKDLSVLKKELSTIEGCFHGESSGIDPLIAYLDKPILMRSKTSLEELDKIPPLDSFFLIDTHISRQTSPFVKIFIKKYNDFHYKRHCQEILIPAVDEAIDSFLKEKKSTLFEAVHQISFFQHRYFDEMIPTAFKNIWLEGLASDHFKLKLCGAGGGGFIIGIGDYTKIKNYEELSIIDLKTY